MNKDFNPGKYGMITCPLCNGKGFLFEKIGVMRESARTVCTKCGGFAFIMKDENTLIGQENSNSVG